MAKAATDRIYHLKVTLVGARPPIWRRLLVSSSTTLRQLHDILQIAMGWTDSHLHQFEARGEFYGEPSAGDFGPPMKDEARARLGQILSREKDSIVYEYDFGDSWTHQIVLEKILVPSPELKTPVCTAGARACPPEDCGGVFGYARLLKVLKNPSHSEHEETLEWVGEAFDPELFDPDAINKQLSPRKSEV